MGGEAFIVILNGMILGCLLGLLIAFSLKLIRKKKTLPAWPILLFAFFGGMLPAVLHHWR